MKPLMLLPLVFAGGALFAWADRPSPRRVDSTRVVQMQRNLPLVEKLVDGGVQLAGEKEALKRAEYCNVLAGQLADEIQHAASRQEGDRALELGQHLHTLLKHGVAGNLRSVSVMATPGSAREQEMRRVGDRSEDLMKPVEDQLEQELARVEDADHEEMRHTLKAIRDGRAEIEKALKPQQPAAPAPQERPGP